MITESNVFRLSKVSRGICTIVGMGMGIMALWFFFTEPYSARFLILFSANAIVSILLLTTSQMYIIRISEQSITKEYFLKRSFIFKDIIRVDVQRNLLDLFTKNAHMTIPQDFERQDELLRTILNNLNNVQGIDYRGEDADLRKFGLQDRVRDKGKT